MLKPNDRIGTDPSLFLVIESTALSLQRFIFRFIRSLAVLGGVVFAVSYLLSLGDYAAIVTLALLATGVGMMTSFQNCLLTASAIIVSSLAMLGLVTLLPDPFYRPHDRFAVTDHYLPNVRDVREMPFGNLVGISIAAGLADFEDIAIPRRIEFNTDSRGFRNDLELQPDSEVLIGDSFVVGNGTTQEEILPKQLTQLSGKNAYGVAFPGGIGFYLRNLDRINRTASLFLFEGNDFYGGCRFPPKDLPQPFGFLLTTARHFKTSVEVLRKFTLYYNKAFLALGLGTGAPSPEDVYVVRMTGGIQSILLKRDENKLSEVKSYVFPSCIVDAFAKRKHMIKTIFLIPTKYRVYYPYFTETDVRDLPHAHWEALRALGKRLSISVHDLTPSLREAAGKALANKQFVYWPDDSHWNGLGIETAAREYMRVVLNEKPRR